MVGYSDGSAQSPGSIPPRGNGTEYTQPQPRRSGVIVRTIAEECQSQPGAEQNSLTRTCDTPFQAFAFVLQGF